MCPLRGGLIWCIYPLMIVLPCHCMNLRNAARKVSALYDVALEPLGITIAQFSLLRRVERLGPVSLTELGRVTDHDRSTIGRNVRLLEKMGLLAQGKGKDQRETMVTLTAEGHRVLAEGAPLWDACQARIEDRLGPERIAAIADILTAL